MEQLEKCIKFLENNGYSKQDSEEEFQSMVKANVSRIDLNENEIVFIDDIGDWIHLPCNYYALIGALIHYSQLGIGYKKLKDLQ